MIVLSRWNPQPETGSMDLTPMPINPAAAATENIVTAQQPGFYVVMKFIAKLSVAAALLSLLFAAALALVIWGAAGLATADGGYLAAFGLPLAGIISGVVLLCVNSSFIVKRL